MPTLDKVLQVTCSCALEFPKALVYKSRFHLLSSDGAAVVNQERAVIVKRFQFVAGTVLEAGRLDSSI